MKKTFSVILFSLTLLAVGCKQPAPETMTMLVGTYTNSGSEGIYVYNFDEKNLAAELISSIEVNDPSYLAISPDKKSVYSVSEGDSAHSFVNAYSFDEKKGELTFLNKVPVGEAPCFIWIDPDMHFVVSANYTAGSMSVIPLASNRSLKDEADVYTFKGKGPDSTRQEKSHIHCIANSPDGKYLFVTDLGADRIYSYPILKDKLEAPFLGEATETVLTPGSGPRHLIFNKAGDKVYLINELSGNVTVFDHDKGHLTEIESILADTCHAAGSAGILLSPDEKFLYVSTRLEGDGIVIFKVASDGCLTKVGYQATARHPRNFNITPDGNLLLVGSKDEACIQIFERNKETGLLVNTNKTIEQEQPVCILFVE